MGSARCHCCGKPLYEGNLKYVVEIRCFADFDNYLEEHEDDLEEGINELLDAVESMDMEALEEDIYKVQVFILCKGCRDKFSDDPFQTGSSAMEFVEHKGTIH